MMSSPPGWGNASAPDKNGFDLLLIRRPVVFGGGEIVRVLDAVWLRVNAGRDDKPQPRARGQPCRCDVRFRIHFE